MNEPNPLNIPAYQRKRSIAAKARRAATKPAGRSSGRKTSRPSRATNRRAKTFEEPLLENSTHIREMKMCGICEGYLDGIEVAVVKLTAPLREGDRIIFEKQDGLFEQSVDSMQINRKHVTMARTGSDIGLKVAMKPNVGTTVYKVL